MSEYQYYEFRAIDRPLTAEELGELRRLSTRAKITPIRFVNVYHFGDFRGDPLALMEQYFDAFVYVALYEGFGLPVLEAMARGVPTVASTAASIPEVAGEAALGVDARSVRDIARALRDVLTDSGLAGKLSLRGRARSELFSWDETARGTLSVYERVTGAK